MTTPRYRTDVAGRRAGGSAGLPPLQPPIDLTPAEVAAMDAAQARGDQVAVNRIIAAARARVKKDCGCGHGDAAPQARDDGLLDEEAARQNMYRDAQRNFDSNGGRRKDGRPARREDGVIDEERLRLDMEADSRSRSQRRR